MASNTSGSFTTNLAAGSNSADKYTMTLAYNYSHIPSNNKTNLTITGTIKSNNSAYSSYRNSSKNTVYVCYNNSDGYCVLSKTPTTAYDCRNQGSTQIFSYSIDVPHDESGNRTVWIYWSFDGLQSQWNPTGSVSGIVYFPQSIYTLAYDSNGGIGDKVTDTVYYGQSYITKGNSFTKAGYKFVGWNESSDGSGVDWTDWIGKEWVWTYTKNVTLYAQWEENILTVNYYSNYATESFENPLNEVGKDKNVLVKTEHYDYSEGNESGLRNYSNKTNSMYLGRIGYKATEYWGTESDGGYLLHQDEGFSNGQELAEKLGLSLKEGDVSVDLYPQWKIQNVAYVKIDGKYTMCLVYIKVDGSWKPAIAYVKDNGIYKQSIT